MKIKEIKYVNSNESNSIDEVKKIEVIIGKTMFTITESIDHKLTINKAGEETDSMFITPRYTNEIEIL